jgi:uroporphyrinogen-III decarboxylase
MTLRERILAVYRGETPDVVPYMPDLSQTPARTAPTPTGDLSAAECRREAGDRFILSGGVSPNLWMPDTPLAEFEKKVMEWLDQKKTMCRFIANAGDQVPPGADERRIAIMRELVEKHGRF